MINSSITLSSEFIELNALLKVQGLASSGGAAKVMIGAGLVQVDDQVETRVRRKLRGGEVVRVGDERVSVIAAG